MKLFSEHTEWSGGGANHWYLLSDNRSTMHGYRKFGQEAVTMFKTPLPFYEKGRRLKLEHDFGDMTGEAARNLVQVIGSKGDVYTVDLSSDRPTCTCHAFKFRGGCKHISAAKSNV
jgi:hypothetical protein